MVVLYYHRSEGYGLQQHPRGDVSSPRRPNPIGATIVDLIAKVRKRTSRSGAGCDQLNAGTLFEIGLIILRRMRLFRRHSVLDTGDHYKKME